MIENINWYPGHMKKTRELIQENLKMVDLAIEVIDGRIPVSSRNPIIDELVKSKKRIIILNKSDLSDQKANDEWAEHFKKDGNIVLQMNCMSYLSGTGKAIPTLILSLARQILLFVPIMLVMRSLWGETGMMMAYAVTDIVAVFPAVALCAGEIQGMIKKLRA